MKKYLPFLIISLFLITTNVRGIDMIGSNEFFSRFSLDQKEIIENSLELRLFEPSGAYAGITYFSAHRSDLHPYTQVDSVAEGITKRFAGFANEYVDIQAGNFYIVLGNGLLLDCSEFKAIKLDNNLDGMRFKLNFPYSDFTIFSGRANWDRGSNIKGGDGNLAFKGQRLGISYLQYQLDDFKEEGYSARLNLSFKEYLFTSEYAFRQPHGGTSGNGVYLTLDIPILISDLFIEYKRYDNMLFRTARARYNNPPWGIAEPIWFLQSREVYHLDYDNEEGVRGIFYFPITMDWEFLLDIAVSGGIDEMDKFKSYSSELNYGYDRGDVKLILEYQQREFDGLFAVLNTHRELSEKINSELTLELSSIDKGITTEYNYSSSLEFVYNGWLTIGGGYSRVDDADALLSTLGITTFKYGDISLLIGKYPGGVICSEGVCRNVLPFEGAEIRYHISF